MMRNVYLQGELGEKFGNKFSMEVNTHAEIIKCINANRPEFKNYLIECDKNDIGFTIEYQNELVDEDTLLVPLKEGDVTIAIVPAGSKSGVGKIIAAAFLVFFVLPAMGASAGAITNSMTGAIKAGLGAKGGFAVATMATNLAITGIGQIMAPDPATDSDAPENYSFNGNAQNIKQGDPVPLLYGELRIPGRPISINVDNTTPTFVGYYEDGTGNTDPVDEDGGGNTKETTQTSLH